MSDIKTSIAFEDLPPEIREAIADINACNNILLAYLSGHTQGFNEDNAKHYAIKIHDTCQELMK